MDFMEYVESTGKASESPLKDKRLVAAGIAVLAIILAAVVAAVGLSGGQSHAIELTQNVQAEAEGADGAEGAAEEQKEEPVSVCVYVTGAVASPGICYLDEGARVADAVEACGGFLPEASASSINLARSVQDGEQIDVLTQEQVAAAQTNVYASDAPSQSSDPADAGQLSGKVNINTADSSALQTLSGIGESKAQKIIDHRQANGHFKSIEGLKDVSGIGDKTFESLKDSICI